ncbi:MAG: extracellular solute-binding protein, partial [Acetobacteraceae bacterium]
QVPSHRGRGRRGMTLGRKLISTAALCLALLSPAARADSVTTSSAISILGTPALLPDFAHFPYVNPAAPKDGEVRLAALGTYDSFNPFILRGRSVAGLVGAWVILPGGSGSGASIGHVWESLLASSSNEAATAYCHVCATIETPEDRSWIAFTLRPEARFSDGVALTSDDIAWTFRTLIAQGSPAFRIQLGGVATVETDGPHRIVYRLKPDHDRSLPLLLGELPILPEHFFKGRDFTQPLTAAPIGSGPYKVTAFELGRSVTFERDPTWWARDLPTAIGTNNFDRVRVDWYRDASVALEAFKAGQADLRAENISKNWAQAYDFPAVKDGRVIKADIRHHLPTGLQGWVMNTRRPTFHDPLVRQAIAWAYDFQWANKNLFFGAYTRSTSYFENSDLASTGLPDAGELALLDPFRAELPPVLFTEPFTLPVTDGSGHNRAELMTSLALLEKAGWKVHDMKLVNAQGQQMKFTILLDDPSFERVALPYVQTLKHLGIDVDVRTVDPAQFQRLTDDFDFDMTMVVIPENEIPGSALADDFSCAAAKQPGSNNLSGVCDPAVDDLVGKVLAASDRASLRTAARALDRVLLRRWYLVPAWGNQVFHVAYWNRFGQPGIPLRDGVDFDTWWVDSAKAQATDATRAKSGG